ncbi:MAG TPA: hypothetical protein VJB39_01985 [Patescibacteria group bacterium]|nr:hypothetical protein [Patescibacteria group bacterium]
MKRSKQIKFLIITLLVASTVIFFFSWGLEKASRPQEPQAISNLIKYSISLREVNSLLNSDQFDFFSRDDFKMLKAFVTLPIQIGLVGNGNPFQSGAAAAEVLINPF